MTKPAAAATDQVYFTASLENAMMDREQIERRVASAVAGALDTADRLQQGVDRIRLVTDRS